MKSVSGYGLPYIPITGLYALSFEEYDIYVYFDDGNKSDKLEMYLNVNDGKYSIHCLGDNECKDGTIKSYLQSFIDRQGIVIE